MKKLLPILVLWLCFTVRANAATYAAASMNSSDIQAAINAEALANPGGLGGDVIVVPDVPQGGKVTWTPGGIIFTNPITLQGPGTNGQCQAFFANIVDTTPSWTVSALSVFTTNTPNVGTNEWRITGFTISGNTTNGAAIPGVLGKGIVQLIGNGYNVRLDHNCLSNLDDWMVCTYGVCGVADHNSFLLGGNTFAFEFTAENWNGGNYSDGAWAAPTGLGTSNFFFVENNNILIMTNAGGGSLFASDATAGARFVMRYNVISNGVISLHGTETGGAARGPRAFEIYNNTEYQSLQYDHPVNIRGGTGVIYNNSVIYVGRGFFNPYFQAVNSYGTTGFYPDWGAFNGTNQLCINSTNGGGSAVVYATFTCSNTSVIAPYSSPYWYTVFASGPSPNWRVNQWRGYSIVDKTEPVGATQSTCTNFSLVSYSTANSITFLGNSTGTSANNIFNAGDTCVLYLQTNVLDMPGMGQCRGWVRDPNTGAVTNNGIALAQAVEPIYTWNNLINGVPMGTTNVFAVVKPNIHYVDGTPAPGYTAFTYPHPLVSSESLLVSPPPPPPPSPPDAPTNLRLVSPGG